MDTSLMVNNILSDGLWFFACVLIGSLSVFVGTMLILDRKRTVIGGLLILCGGGLIEVWVHTVLL